MALSSTVALSVAGAPCAFAAQDPAQGLTLRKYDNPDSDDAAALAKQGLQESYANQQKMVALSFRMQHGDRVDMEFLWYASGHEIIPGYLFRARSDMAGAHPAIILVHGGIHGSLNEEWFDFIAELTARGYVVFVPEYRGSRGYGSDIYANDYGVTDVADVIAAGKYLAAKPFVDARRMAILGRSRGGMVTLLAIQQQPEMFRAAIDIVGLTDLVAYMAYKPGYRRDEIASQPSYEGKLPFENLSAYMRASPINAVDKIQTPLLVLATSGDESAPVELHTGRLVDALRARGKTFDAKVYDHAPGGHLFMYADTPERADARARVFAWLERYNAP